jgi:hypothetical protein
MALLASKLPKANPKRSRIVVFTYGSKPAVLVQGWYENVVLHALIG